MSSHEVFGGLINYYRNFGASGGNYYDLQGTTSSTTSGATVLTQGHPVQGGHGTVVATGALPAGQHIVHAGNHAGQIVTSAGGTTLQILPAMVVPKIEVKTEQIHHQQQQVHQQHHAQQQHHVVGGGSGGSGAPIHISGTWKCQFCDKVLSSKGNLKAHLHNVHSSPSERGEACPVCAKVFSCKGNLKAHLDNIHSTDMDRRRWTCEFCSKVLSSKGNLKLHITSIHTKGGPSFPCHYCFKVYSSKGNQKAHIENVHRGEILTTNAVAVAAPGTQPTNNSGSKSGEGGGGKSSSSSSSDEWRCVYCSKVLSTKGNLKIHVNTVHAGEGTHACPHCHKTFSSKGNLKTHVENLHGDGKKDWLCSFCQKTLSSKGNLKLHIKNVHKNLDGVISGTTPATSAASSVDLQQIQNEWRCEFCYKILGSKSALKTHINALHANELGLRKAASWTCQICYKALSSKAALLTHIQIVHEKRRDFKCDHCPQTFSSQNLLKTHVKNDHQNKIAQQQAQQQQQQQQQQTHQIPTQIITPTSGAEAAAAAAAAAAVAAAQAEHNSQSYYCEFCPRDLYGRPTKLFAHPKDLQGHMYTEHGVTVAVPEPAKDEKCHICPKIFPRREDLQAHLAKDHGYATS